MLSSGVQVCVWGLWPNGGKGTVVSSSKVPGIWVRVGCVCVCVWARIGRQGSRCEAGLERRKIKTAQGWPVLACLSIRLCVCLSFCLPYSQPIIAAFLTFGAGTSACPSPSLWPPLP